MTNISRERFSFTFDGGAIASHEISVSILADSLLALNSIVEEAGKAQFGKNADVIMKVKGSPQEGSLCIDLIIDWSCKNPELAIFGLTTIGYSITKAVTGAIKLYKWAKGKPITIEKADGNSQSVTNVNGEQTVLSNCIVNLYINGKAKRDFDKLTKPLEAAGIDSIALSGESENESAEILKNDREFFVVPLDQMVNEDEDMITLEILTPNCDGKPTGWRFYDGGAEYTATIEDHEFLTDVENGKYRFGRGDMVNVVLRTVQRRPNKRLITDRYILRVEEYIPNTETEA